MWDGAYHMDGGFFFMPFVMLFLGLAWVLLFLWVVYDVATREDMATSEKVLWIIVSLFLWAIGPLLYILVVKLPGKPIFGGEQPERSGLSELERLADLHERGLLSDDEFEEMKEEYLERLKED